MLFQKLGKMKRSWIMTSVVMIFVALVLLICPADYLGVLISVLGYALLTGAAVMILDFLSSKKVLINYITFAGAMLIALLGLVVLIKRGEVLPTLGLLFGIVLVLEGISDLYSAFIYARRAGFASWVTLAVLSAVTVACGVIILINPWWDSLGMLKMVIGYMLLFTTVANIIRVILTWPFKSV